MKNSKDLFRDLRKQITLAEDAAEIDSILYLVLEDFMGISRSDVITQKSIYVTEDQEQQLLQIIARINTQEPVQYILEKAHFYGRDFLVNPSVLIPRAETELLISEVLKQVSNVPGKILDIGTGSGCIAITLAKELSKKTVTTYDISETALSTAMQNAKNLQAPVTFQKLDILNQDIDVNNLDLIVSNPPYVTVSEKDVMNDNVLKHEPHLALFVPDHDPLLFYKIIAQKGWESLVPGGKIIVEINERFGQATAEVFLQRGYSDVVILKDLQNKDRIVSASKV